MRRRLSHEMMDDPAVPRGELAHSLRYLRILNRWMGGSRALVRNLSHWSVNWPKGTPISMLDIGTGSADIPLAVRRWGLARGYDIRVTGVDPHETTLALAREHGAWVGQREPRVAEGITLVRADARRLMDEFATGSFDYVHAGAFLHHLPDIEVMTVLRIMDRLARRGIVWNDVVRSVLVRGLVEVAVIGAQRIVRHDGRASVEAGFTRREVLHIARRVGVDYARYRRSMFLYRFTLAGEKPGAWA